MTILRQLAQRIRMKSVSLLEYENGLYDIGVSHQMFNNENDSLVSLGLSEDGKSLMMKFSYVEKGITVLDFLETIANHAVSKDNKVEKIIITNEEEHYKELTSIDDFVIIISHEMGEENPNGIKLEY